MRKVLILILLNIWISSIKSQEYIPTLVEGNNWDVMKGLGMGAYVNYSYVIRCDTLINNLNYKKATSLNSISEYGLYREDINSKRIYKWNSDLQSEELLIDYSLELGDTIVIGWQTLTVDSIRTNELYGLERKIIYLDYAQYFIEGIGYSLFGIHDFGGWQKITDFKETDLNCNLTLTTNSNEETITIFPNPTSGIIKINRKDLHETSGVIINNLGQIVKAVEFIKVIDLSELVSGIYYLRIKENNNLFRIIKL
jgi:hypothetical protein